MILSQRLLFFFILLGTMPFSKVITAQKSYDEKKIEVAMRMIGHQFLQKVGDSSSRVLPITKIKDQYKVQFESKFAFRADDLIETINTVIKETNIATTYIVEVTDCKNGAVVYSYGIDSAAQLEILPCAGRPYPTACYNILLTLKEAGITYPMSNSNVTASAIKQGSSSNKIVYALGAISLLLLGVFFFVKNRKQPIPDDPNIIKLGKFQFDKRNFTLSTNGQSQELSGKEADLLLLLVSNKNETLERDTILKEVWGDAGDYIGRTLDVFISKLRKKLEADENIKIVNIRSVGYKLVIE